MIRLVPAPRRLAVPAWALAVVVGWLAAVVAYTWIAHRAGGAPVVCHLRRLTGVPCPTCGSTRAAFAAADGRWLEAFAHNPFMSAAAIVGAAWLVVRLGWGRRVQVAPSMHKTLWIVVVGLLVMNWAYLVWRA